MSKIIRAIGEAPAVFIGERHRDSENERRAVEILAKQFPTVSYVTAPDGAKLIPLTEVFNFESVARERTEEAHRSAFEQGEKTGMEKGLDEARKVLKDFERAISDAVGQRQSMLDAAREKILDLVIQISRKVTFGAIEADRETTITMISNIINQLTDRTTLKIKVHPDFLPIVEAGMDRFLVGATDIKDLTFEGDSRVKFGGCFIETPSGDIDARLESQLAVVEDVLHSGEGPNE